MINDVSGWKPNKWIAALLGFFLQPLGMLYVIRVKWAGIYFLVTFVISLLEFYLSSANSLPWDERFTFNYVVMVVCGIHAYKIANSRGPVTARPWYSQWYGLVSLVVIVLGAIVMIRAFLYEPFRFPSLSMYPTINRGEILITKKWGYGNYGTFGITLAKSDNTQTIHRGDLIVFEYPVNRNIAYAKRVIGIPGDVVIYRNKELYINGNKITSKVIDQNDTFEVLEEDLAGSTHQVIHYKDRVSANADMTVPEDSYFVLGDNRDNSNDSRYWGVVPDEAIIGKVVYIIN